MTSLLVESMSLILNKPLIHKNYYHLYSLMNENILWLFPCSTNDISGVLIPDSGATKCYADRIFVKKTHVLIQKFPVEKQIELAGDKKLIVYETCHLSINISDWQEIIFAYILNLNIEFDIMLELNWIRKRKSTSDWDIMMLTLEHEGKIYLLMLFPRHIISIDNKPEWKLNIITFRQALNALKHSSVQTVLYYIRNLEVDMDVEAEVGMEQLHGPEFQAVVAEYSDVFKDELSDYLSSMRDLVREIDIDDSESINWSVY